jgi:MarR family transcriptional regulator, organic hydroperoxide resistance regulator
MAHREKPSSGVTLVELVARAHALLTESLYEHLKWRHPSANELRIMAALNAHGGIAMKELADLVFLKQPTLTKAIDRMERAKLVERRIHPTNRRRTLVHLTEHGRRASAPLVQRAQDHAAAIERLVGEAKSHELKAALSLLISQLGSWPTSHARSSRRRRTT